jgi:tRNA C32,U32 (ribose-2'-O)-methylase TrmJ
MRPPDSNSTLQAIRIVLAGADSETVGSVCRAMKTMGVSDLRIAGPVDDLDLRLARLVAVHAEDVLDSVSYHPSIEEAVAGCRLTAVVTKSLAHLRESTLSASDFAELFVGAPPIEISSNTTLQQHSGALPREAAARGRSKVVRTAVVFRKAHETDGYDISSHRDCDVVIAIPDSLATLTISHSVQVICYEIYRRLERDRPAAGDLGPIDSETFERLISSIAESLKTMGADDTSSFFRPLLARSELTLGESNRLLGLFQKLAGVARQRASVPKGRHSAAWPSAGET